MPVTSMLRTNFVICSTPWMLSKFLKVSWLQLYSWVLPCFWWQDTVLQWLLWLLTPNLLILPRLRICVDLLLDFCLWTSHSWEEFIMVLLRLFMRLATLMKNYKECNTRWLTHLYQLSWPVGLHLYYCLLLHWLYLTLYGHFLHLCLHSWSICKWIKSVLSMVWHLNGSVDIEDILL